MTNANEMLRVKNKEQRVNEISPRFLSTSIFSPFATEVAGARMMMFNGHLGQTPTLVNPTNPTIMVGVEPAFGKWTNQVRTDEDSVVLRRIARHAHTINSTKDKRPPGEILIVEKMSVDKLTGLECSELDYLDIPRFHTMHQQFGFEYKYNESVISTSKTRQHIPKGTVLASSPSICHKTGMWRYGVQLDSAALTIPQVIEDGVVIDEYAREACAVVCVESYRIAFGDTAIPLNIHGDYNNYKFVNDIGETVPDDGVLAAIRKVDAGTSPAIMSRSAVRRYDSGYDDVIIVEPGAKIVDIKVYHNTRADEPYKKKSPNTPKGMENQARFYYESDKRFYKEVLDFYNHCLRNNKGEQLNLSRNFHRLVREAIGFTADPSKDRLVRCWRGVPLDEWVVDVTISYVWKPNIGSKLAGQVGNKGVITDIWPTEDMPVDEAGNRAHFLEDVLSQWKRMIMGREYSKYVAATARDLRGRLINMKNAGEPIENLQKLLWRYYEIIDEDVYKPISTTLPDGSTGVDLEHLNDALNDQIYVVHPPSSQKESTQLIRDLRREFPAVYGPVTYRALNGEFVKTKSPVLVGGQYLLVSEKIGKSLAAVSSSKLNHIGIPAKSTSRDKHAYGLRYTPIRFGESEFRLFVAMLGGRDSSEILKRSNNPAIRREILNTIIATPVAMKMFTQYDPKKYTTYSRVVSMIDNFNHSSGKYFVQTYIDSDGALP